MKRMTFSLILVLTMLLLCAAAHAETKKVELIEFTLPYTSNGITVIDVDNGGYDALRFRVRNDSDVTVDGNSSLAIKFTNEKYVVMDVCEVPLTHLLPGESGDLYLYYDYESMHVTFGEVTIKEAEADYAPASSVTNKIKDFMWVMPSVEKDGLLFTVTGVDSANVWMTLYNGSDSAVSCVELPYKCYTNKGVV